MALTDDQKRRIRELRKAETPLRDIVEAVGCTDGQLNRFLYKKQGTQAEKSFAEVRESTQASDEIAALRRQVTEAAREETAVERIVAALHREMSKLPAPPPTKFTKPSKGASAETMLISLTDWHYGEQVDAERMRGLNEYNSRIAADRVAHVVGTIRDIKNRLEVGGGWYFPDAVVVLGGDMVSGTIHDLERNSDDTIVCTSLGCANLLFQALQDLSTVFPQVTVTGVVGNHGRLPDARRKQYKDPERNWDYLIYEAVAWRMANFKNMSFGFPRSHSMVLGVRNKNIFISHGDEYRAQFSLPYYGVDRATRGHQAIEASRGKPLDYTFIHHWHSSASTPLPGGHRNILMPSLKGGDEYILEKMGVCPPAEQWIAGFNEVHGITHQWHINCQTVDKHIPNYRTDPWA